MFGPGVYVPDPTEGIVDVKDLPAPQYVPYSRNQSHTPCPRCDQRAARHTAGQRTLHDLGELATGRPVDLLVTYSSHDCAPCQTYCNIDRAALAPPGSHYTNRVIDMAVRLVVEDRLPYRPASWHLWREHRVCVPCATLHHWLEAGGNKGAGTHERCVAGLGVGDLLGGRRCR
jgi:hypothetical protein